MTDLHPVTIVFAVIGVLAITGFALLAFYPDRSGLPDPDSLLDPEYRDLDLEKVLELKRAK